MTLRFIPDPTKVSPFEMVVRNFKEMEKRKQKEEKKRKESLAHVILMQKVFNMLGVSQAFMGTAMNGYIIDEIFPKGIFSNIKKSLLKEFFEDGFNKPEFNQTMGNLFNEISAKYNETDKIELATKIIKKFSMEDVNQILNKSTLVNQDVNIEEAKNKLKEMKLATMIMISANDEELSKLKDNLKGNELFDSIYNSEEIKSMRSTYLDDVKLENKSKNENKKKMKIKMP